MRHIAILGATSQVASDLILGWAGRPDVNLDLFARRPLAVTQWLARQGLVGRFAAAGFERFGADDTCYDAVINFVGVGDPGRASELGAAILDVTLQYDGMALAYQDRFPACRYLFLSSGGAYGTGFVEPASRATPSQIAINDLRPQEFYAVAKLHAEARHRARATRPITDIRIFNIFSRTQDIKAQFFITDIIRAIRDKTVLKVAADGMVRDFLHPSDLQQLVDLLLAGPAANVPLDCYSRAPVDKQSLLQAMEEWFGLKWEYGSTSGIANATGAKPKYYSSNARAAEFGYQPRYTSLEGLRLEVGAILAG